MRTREKDWFTREAKRAGWISAFATVAALGAVFVFARPTWTTGEILIYPGLPIALGCVAVAALHFRHWPTFEESVAASALAFICMFIWVPIVCAVVVLVSPQLQKLLLAVFLLNFYILIPTAIWILLLVPFALVIACISGAVSYAMLVGVRSKWGDGADKRKKDDLRPRPLRMLG